MTSSLPVAVTGASGYVGSWVVREFLARGYTVHATVRDPERPDRVAHLVRASEGQPGTLHLHRADLLQEGSFDRAFAGCGIVVHTASPFFIKAKDPQKELVDPALQGTRNVLGSVERAPTVTRVVLTSSVAAINGDVADLQGRPADETMWNTTSSLTHSPYAYSKTVAEREAWRLATAQTRWRLVTINPSFIMGPSLSARNDSTSIDFLVKMLDGSRRSGMPRLYNGYVDVREVAFAHAEAALRPDAEGRYLLSAETMNFMDLAALLREVFPGRPLPTRAIPGPLVYLVGPLLAGFTWKYVSRNLGIPVVHDNRRSREGLGVTYRPLRDTFRDHGEQLVRDGLLR
jgi:dihydroflavonol-4-reductase